MKREKYVTRKNRYKKKGKIGKKKEKNIRK